MQELIHFTADWCQPCKRMAPVIDAYVANNPDIKYVKIDIEKDAELFENYQEYQAVMSVPTFFGMVDGELRESHVGIATPEQINSLFA
jgi:thioredoxin 1